MAGLPHLSLHRHSYTRLKWLCCSTTERGRTCGSSAYIGLQGGKPAVGQVWSPAGAKTRLTVWNPTGTQTRTPRASLLLACDKSVFAQSSLVCQALFEPCRPKSWGKPHQIQVTSGFPPPRIVPLQSTPLRFTVHGSHGYGTVNDASSTTQRSHSRFQGSWFQGEFWP